MINNIGNENSLLNQFISELRDEKIQKDQNAFQEKHGKDWRNICL